jgi:MFS transporter, MHS family, alpha-ketoglutarate permease
MGPSQALAGHFMPTTTSTSLGQEHLQLADMRRRLRAIFIGSVGKLVEWYDFYAYAAFALYFANSLFPG